MTMISRVKESLYDVIDPELGVNIMDLGLVYRIEADRNNNVTITMTLTTPGCPMHDSIANGVKHRIGLIEDIKMIHVDIVWEPAWTPDKMSDQAKEMLWS